MAVGTDLATYAAPIALLPAPGRFSTVTGWSSASFSFGGEARQQVGRRAGRRHDQMDRLVGKVAAPARERRPEWRMTDPEQQNCGSDSLCHCFLPVVPASTWQSASGPLALGTACRRGRTARRVSCSATALRAPRRSSVHRRCGRWRCGAASSPFGPPRHPR